MLPPLRSLQYFEAVARHLSFSRAAEELHLTHSALSHQIKALEEWLGQPLFERQARSLRLTEAARRLLPPVAAAFRQLEAAMREAGAAGRATPLRLSTLPSLASKWLVPRLYAFRAQYPEIDVHISATERLENVARGEVDAALRYGRGGWPDVTSELLVRDDIFPVCAPRLLEGRKKLTLKDLGAFPLLSDADWGSAYDFWGMWLTAAGANADDFKAAGHKGGISSNVSSLMLQAAVDGLGIGLGNRMLALDDLKAGRLVRPFDFTLTLETGYFLVYGKNALKNARLRVFRDWLFAQAEEVRQSAL